MRLNFTSCILISALTFFPGPAHADTTDRVTLAGNLDSRTAADDTPSINPGSFAAINAAASFTSEVQVTDSQNADHAILIAFFHTDIRIWRVQWYVDGAEVGGTAGVPSAVYDGSLPLAFSNSGVLDGLPISVPTNSINWTNGAAPSTIYFELSAFTQLATPSNISNITRECLFSCFNKGRLDFDGDNKDDFAIYRPSIGYWAVLKSSSNTVPPSILWIQWGLPGDHPMPGDYDGDRKTDLAVWRPSNGNWYICSSSTNFNCSLGTVQQWGLPGDRPIKGDFDGDGKQDLTVWRPSDGSFYSRSSFNGFLIQQQWGFSTDIPLGDAPSR